MIPIGLPGSELDSAHANFEGAVKKTMAYFTSQTYPIQDILDFEVRYHGQTATPAMEKTETHTDRRGPASTSCAAKYYKHRGALQQAIKFQKIPLQSEYPPPGAGSAKALENKQVHEGASLCTPKTWCISYSTKLLRPRRQQMPNAAAMEPT